MPGFGPRGGDIDSNGVVWVSLASGHLGSFDRSKCKAPLNGPKATGDHCPEGWTFYQYPGSGLRGHRREQRRGELLHLGRPAQHARARRGRADLDRQPAATALPRSRTARWCCCACPIRWASTPRASTAASTIRTPAGRAAGCGSSSGDRTPWLKEGGKGTQADGRALPGAARPAGEVSHIRAKIDRPALRLSVGRFHFGTACCDLKSEGPHARSFADERPSVHDRGRALDSRHGQEWRRPS